MKTKSILYNLFAAATLIGGASLLGSCSDAMSLDGDGNIPQVAGKPAGKLTFDFSKSTRAGETAEADATKTEVATDDEKAIKSLYVAFFYDGNLYKMFSTAEEESKNLLKETNTNEYTVDEPGYTGAYKAYVIANPTDAVVTELNKLKDKSIDNLSATTYATVGDPQTIPTLRKRHSTLSRILT